MSCRSCRPVFVGTDPGGRWTGIAARSGNRYLGHELVTRPDPGRVPGREYLDRVVTALAGWTQGWGDVPVFCAVEGTCRPGERRGAPDPDSDPVTFIALGMVLGVIESYFPQAIIIAPSGYQRQGLGAYPEQLVGPDEVDGDAGVLRHCRDAWDVAGAAQQRPRWRAERKCSVSPDPLRRAAS
jgi:hypothetical protein